MCAELGKELHKAGLQHGARCLAKRKSFDILIFQKSKTSENHYNKIATQHSEARQE